jgi:hypothetical protein
VGARFDAQHPATECNALASDPTWGSSSGIHRDRRQRDVRQDRVLLRTTAFPAAPPEAAAAVDPDRLEGAWSSGRCLSSISLLRQTGDVALQLRVSACTPPASRTIVGARTVQRLVAPR